mmetsp:Transcript_108065/g.304418  ORF Transcript_108065/g.304418 Transcript_108065/m.304418 type:complete len:320 (-) Transcript_108065:119-1078(-)
MGNAVASPFACCLIQQHVQEVNFLKATENKVDLAVSELGGIPGLMAYHTSIVVNGEELFFSPMGIQRNRGLESHRHVGPDGELMLPFGNTEKPGIKVIEMGSTAKSAETALQALAPHFQPGSYDLLHKNCNTFTDVALYFLLGVRLDSTYNSIEKVGANKPWLLEQVTRGAYVANPQALAFNLDEVLQMVGEVDDEIIGPNGQRRLSIGTVVRITGLRSEMAKHFNDKVAIVQRLNSQSCRYEVRVQNETKALRPENLEAFQVRQDMRIDNLKSESAKHLNGEHCQVLKFNTHTDRLEVKITSTGEVKALKAENVHSLA